MNPPRFIVNWDPIHQQPEAGCFHYIRDSDDWRAASYFSASYRNNQIDTIEFMGKEYRFQKRLFELVVRNSFEYHHWQSHPGCVLQNLTEGWTRENMEEQTLRITDELEEMQANADAEHSKERWLFPNSFSVSAERRYKQIESGEAGNDTGGQR